MRLGNSISSSFPCPEDKCTDDCSWQLTLWVSICWGHTPRDLSDRNPQVPGRRLAHQVSNHWPVLPPLSQHSAEPQSTMTGRMTHLKVPIFSSWKQHRGRWRCQRMDFSLCVRAKPLQSCLTLCGPMEYSLPGSSVHGIFQPRTLEWVAIYSSWGFSQPRDWTNFRISCIAGGFFRARPPGISLYLFSKDALGPGIHSKDVTQEPCKAGAAGVAVWQPVSPHSSLGLGLYGCRMRR